MDQIPDIQLEVEPPANQNASPKKPPTTRKPRGTALMDAPGWSNIDEGNIIKTHNEGRSTRRSTGNAMHAEDADQDKMRAGMYFMNSLQTLMEGALRNIRTQDKRNNFKDEEEDNQNSISANSAERENEANKDKTHKKAAQSEESSQP